MARNKGFNHLGVKPLNEWVCGEEWCEFGMIRVMKYQLSPRTFVLPALLGAAAWYFSQNYFIGIAVFVAFLMPSLIKLYIAYAKDNPNQYWFKRKIYGWGWTPVRWQGWVTILVYIAVILLIVMRLDESASLTERLIAFMIPAIPASIIFFTILYKKGESPRWRWGIKDESDEK